MVDAAPSKEGEANVPSNEETNKESIHEESPPDSTFLFEDVSVQFVNANESGKVWVKVYDACRLFETFRGGDKFVPRASVSIEGDHSFKVLDADFVSHKILLDTREAKSVRLSNGAIIVHLGDVPMWRMLQGKGGYDLKNEALYLTHIQSNLMVELGYGSIRVRARQDGESLFVGYDGGIYRDEGVSWARFPRTQGMDEFEGSWFAPFVARDIEAIDDLNPLGKGKPICVHNLQIGCWMGAVTSKGMIVFKNFNCNYTMHEESTEYPISVFLNPAGMMLFISSSDTCILVADREVKPLPKEEALVMLRKFLNRKPVAPYRANAARKHRRNSDAEISDGSFFRSASSASSGAPSRTASGANSRRNSMSRRNSIVMGDLSRSPELSFSRAPSNFSNFSRRASVTSFAPLPELDDGE